MNLLTRLRLASTLLGALAMCLAGPSTGLGQKAPPPANPQGPTINPLPTSGIQRGQPLDVVISGLQLSSPTGVSLAIPAAKITIPTEDKNGQDAGKFRVRIEVPADTPLGWYPLRVSTVKGVSNLRAFCVDDLPTVVGNGTNRAKTSAQEITTPCVVAGAVNNEQGDFYKFTVKAGQRLSVDCLARRLGSAIDACMYIYDAKGNRELAYDNDSPGCQTDPRISYTFKEAGEYLLEIKDVLNRGGAEFFYRVRIGDFPMATTPVPMAAKRGSKSKVAFAGPTVEGVPAVDVDAPNDGSVQVVWVAPKGVNGLHGWPVALALSDHEEAVETEPNDTDKAANRMAVPGGMTGRFHRSDEVDFYIFAAKKGQKLAIEAHTLELFSPTLVYMVLKNAKTGAEVAKSNPVAVPPADQRIDFTAPDDGDLLIEVQHLHFFGGPSETYRLTVRPQAATFEIVLPNERFDVSPGGTAAIPVQIARKGYAGPIELSVKGPSGLSGTAQVKAGQNAALMLVVIKSDLPMGAYQFHIVGKATIDGNAVTLVATAKASFAQAFYGLLYPPMHLPTFVSVAVKEKAPFTLAIKIDPAEGLPGGKATVTVTATRDAGFDEEISLTPPIGLPAPIPAPKAIPAIAKGKTETTFPLDLNPKAPIGEFFIFLGAKTKHQGKEYSGSTPPLILVMTMPFELQVDPAPVSLVPGGKAMIKVNAIRKGGYNGPIALELRKLPPTVTGSKAVIAPDQTSALIEVAAMPNAMPGDLTGIDIVGTASALNNLQSATPPIVIRVQKK